MPCSTQVTREGDFLEEDRVAVLRTDPEVFIFKWLFHDLQPRTGLSLPTATIWEAELLHGQARTPRRGAVSLDCLQVLLFLAEHF